jgi:type II secretory pathway pseudopilin PulG
MSLAPPRANLKLSGPDSRRVGFSLIEVVIAIGVISFALISILGVLSMAMTVHRDASIDSVLSLMTESSLQELRNYNRPTNSLASSGSAYNFSKLTSFTAATPGYIYFDQDGQITGDAYWSAPNSTGATAPTPSTTTLPSTEVGSNMNGSAFSANAGNAGMPLNAAPTALPTGTYYTCQITAIQPTLATGLTSSMYLIKLTFSWPSNASTANQHTRIVMSSISNNTD